MAAKKVTKKRVGRRERKVVEQVPALEQAPVVEEKRPAMDGHRWSLVVIGCLALVLFWWRTNSWPIVAMVNGWPITRFELNQALYRQGGKQILDGIVTQRLIEREIAKKKIQIADNQVEEKLKEVEASVGSKENLQQLLTLQGVTMDEVKREISLQLALEKLVEPSTDSAKRQTAVSQLVQDLRAKAKIWVIK